MDRSYIQALSLFTKDAHYSVIVSANVVCEQSLWLPDANELRTFLLFQVQGRDFSYFSFLPPSGELISSEQHCVESVRPALGPRLQPGSFSFPARLWLCVWPPDSFPPGNHSVGISFCFLNVTFNYTWITWPSVLKESLS